MFRQGYGEEKVTIEAQGAGLWASVDIWFVYLNVIQTYPTNDTRNVDWEIPSTWAAFDRPIKQSTVEGNFKVQSVWHYPEGTLCDNEATANTVKCRLKLNGTPNADKGLIITGKVMGGPTGVRGEDDTMLVTPYFIWNFYTTPKLEPSIFPVQTSEGAYLPPNEPCRI